ncbi:putative ribonuclease H-like domain-containing protein [Tanacetum coccineum]
MYENFNAPSTESLDSIFNRLQKIASQLAILGEIISQEDLNLKFLRSLPAEWNTHVVVWRNNPDLDKMSFDDLYKNFKIVEQEVKSTVSSSSNSSSQNVAFVSTPSSTNDVNTASVQVSTVTPVSTASSNSANLSDATVYAFLANQPDGSQIVHEDLEHIHEDDLEEIDLKWQLALLSMRAREYYLRTGKNITINGSDVAGYDKSKVECFNCHKIGHFTRECRGPRNHENMQRNQDNKNMSQDNSKRTVNVEDTTPTAMIAIDGAGFDWSFMADEEVPTNMALMYDNLRIEFNKSEFDLANYQRGLASVEEQLVFYKKNKVVFCDQIAVLKRDASFKDSEINALKIQIENLKKEQESNLFKINLYENASKSPDAPIIKEWVSDSDEDESEFREIENVQTKPKQANEPRKISEIPRNNSTNWNKPMSKKLGVRFQFTPKACFVELVPTAVLTKSGLVLISTARQSSSKAAVPVSTARPINTTGFKTFVHVAKPRSNVPQKSHSPPKRPFYQQTVLKNRILNNKVNTTKTISVNTAKGKSVLSTAGKQGVNWRPKGKEIDDVSKNSRSYICDPHVALKDTGIFDSECSRHMTGNKSYLIDYQDHDRGFVAFADSSKGGKITRKGRNKTENLDFEDVYFVKELKFNLFSISQMCDMKNSVFFTETECLILSPDFKLPDENQLMLKIPRKDNMYSFDLKNIVPSNGLTCLFAKATNDESNMWHRRLGHINFKTMNKLVKGNLVRGLPSKLFENDHTCVACEKGKQRKASCKTKLVNSIVTPLQILHMDLFGPTFVNSIMGKMYCLVVTDDYSRFSWVFFLAKKDETSSILKNFITGIENQLNHKVKIIRCDNGTDFKNYEMNKFCGIKEIKREFSNARTSQQNGVAERENMTLIEAARTMLANLFLPISFWAEAVNTACYVQNRVLVTKPHNKTPYELLIGRTPIISFMRPFGCPVTILNTLDHLGKFDGKADEGFLVGYSINSKAFRVFNSMTRKVEDNLHVNFLENKPNVVGSGPQWLFDIDTLTSTMNYQPVSARNRTNDNAGLETNSDAGQAGKEKTPDQEYILLPLLHTSSYVPLIFEEDESSPNDDAGKKNEVKDPAKEKDMNGSGEDTHANSTNRLNIVNSPVNTVSSYFSNENHERQKEQRNEYESLFEQDKEDNNSYRIFTPINAATHSNAHDPIDPLIPDLEDTTNL